MTTYNSNPRFLIQQLDSVRMQSKQPDEVVIVDDDSQNTTYEIVDKYINNYKLNNWKAIKNKSNIGFIKTFKKAVELTSGEIIFLCDHDDIWMLNKIEVMFNVLLNNKDINVLCSTFKIIDSDDLEIKIKKNMIYNKDNVFVNSNNVDQVAKIDFKDIFKQNYFQGCISVMREGTKNIFLKNFVDEVPHDYQINIIAALHHSLGVINQELVCYRLHSANTIGLKMNKNLNYESRLAVVKNIYNESFLLSSIVQNEAPASNEYQYSHKITAFNKGRVTSLNTLSIYTWINNLSKYMWLLSKNMVFSYGLDLIIIIIMKIKKNKERFYK